MTPGQKAGLWPLEHLKNVMHAQGDIDGYQVTSRVCAGREALHISYGYQMLFLDIDVISMMLWMTSIEHLMRAAAPLIDVR